jgi:hypothetical protein
VHYAQRILHYLISFSRSSLSKFDRLLLGFFEISRLWASQINALISLTTCIPRSQVAAAIFGSLNVAEWLLRIGATLPPLAIEIAAANGNVPVLQRMLKIRKSSLPALDRAAAAAAKAMRAEALALLIASGAASKSHIRGGGSGRCLFAGPIFSSNSGIPASLSNVVDAERRVLYIPDTHFYGNVAVSIGFTVTGFSMALSAAASLVVLQRVTPPEAGDSSQDVQTIQGDPTGVTYLTLSVYGFDGPARPVIINFPSGGELYNVLPASSSSQENSNSGLVRVGALIPRRQQQSLTQLPVAILNTSKDGQLYNLPSGPWRGRLRHGRVIDCATCEVANDGSWSAECAAPAVDGNGGDDWYATTCGAYGYDSVMATYSKAVYATEIFIGSYMPASTQLRVLARRPEWSRSETTSVSPTSAILHDWSSGSNGGGNDNQDYSTFRVPAVTVDVAAATSRACSTAAPWAVLWAGRAGDVSDQVGRVAPAFLPAGFPTQTLLVEACGLQLRGFANTDGGNVRIL